MPSQHELQQALTWATDKCLILDAENVRLKTTLGEVKTMVLIARTDLEKQVSLFADLQAMFSKKRDE